MMSITPAEAIRPHLRAGKRCCDHGLVDRDRAAYDVLKHLVPAGVGVGEVDVDVVRRIAAGVCVVLREQRDDVVADATYTPFV